ncbi:MAG TPA: glycosyltransferase [Abditibacteriaceae bacterium]|jgi:glycosyltransferase involved in cell wall biosynthesis|nr:glycosyltransferase [Abditibacteriaceae bacterium]
MPLVSVVIPAYNAGHFLEIAVRSVIAQTFNDWELVVVDDGSKEDIFALAELDARVRVIRQENCGQSIARNNGIAQTQSEFVAFLDADDVWLPRKLETQIRLMEERPEVALCHTQFEIINGEDERINHGFGGRMDSYLWLLDGCGIGISTVLVRRSVLGSIGVFNPLAAPTDDYELWLRIARYNVIAGIDEILMRYRMHGKNMSLNYELMFRASYLVLEQHRLAARKRGDRRAQAAARRGQKNIARIYGSQSFDRVREDVRLRRVVQSLPHLGFAVRHSPSFVVESLLAFAMRK